MFRDVYIYLELIEIFEEILYIENVAFVILFAYASTTMTISIMLIMFIMLTVIIMIVMVIIIVPDSHDQHDHQVIIVSSSGKLELIRIFLDIV